MKTFKITDGVFKTEPLFIGNCSYEEMALFLKKRYRAKVWPQGDESDTSGAAFRFNKPPHRVVYIEKMNRGTEAIGVAAHEIAHLVVRICEDKMVPIKGNQENGEVADESFAYLNEFFLTQYLKKI